MIALVAVGIVLLGLKWFQVGPVASLSWWWVALPFAVTFVYWEFIDPHFGFTVRYQARREERRRKERIAEDQRRLDVRNRQ